jgi:hypothetical protein
MGQLHAGGPSSFPSSSVSCLYVPVDTTVATRPVARLPGSMSIVTEIGGRPHTVSTVHLGPTPISAAPASCRGRSTKQVGQ